MFAKVKWRISFVYIFVIKKEYKKIYKEKNKEHISQVNKEYRNDNIEKIKQQANQKFSCECGGCYTYSCKLAHFKTLNHQSYMKSIVQISS